MSERKAFRKRKTLSAQGLLGQQGVSLIEDLVLNMGSRWVPGGANEVGVDGFIELFDPVTREPLGRMVAVQSKAVGEFQNDSIDSFDYWCDRRDLDYWLGLNVPVILIVSRPSSREAYWASIRDRFSQDAPVQSTCVRFSKSNDRLEANALTRLVEGSGPSGVVPYLSPVRMSEVLYSNLLPLVKCPEAIYVASTHLRRPAEVWPKLPPRTAGSFGAWLLNDKRLLAFHDLTEPPWTGICDRGTVEPIPTAEWSHSGDSDKRRLFVRLLNQALRSQLADTRVRYWPDDDCYAFEADPNLSERRVEYRSARQMSTVTIVKKYRRASKDKVFQWFRHLAFRGQFRLLDGQWYLEITPTYRFTEDGNRRDRFHQERLRGIKRLEGNRAVLSGVLLWAEVIGKPKDLFRLAEPYLEFSELNRFKIEVGLDDPSWLESDADKPAASQSLEILSLPLPDEGPEA